MKIKLLSLSILALTFSSYSFAANSSLQGKTIDQLIANRYDGATFNKDQPDYAEISAQPNDLSKQAQAVSIVNLNNYFNDSSFSTVRYTLDASNITAPSAATCQVRLITGVNQVTCADQDFVIKGQVLYANPNVSITSGVYQINVKATDNTSSAYQTFYINVNANNPTLTQWRQGQVASTNVIGNFPSIYIYSNQDPDKSKTAFIGAMQNYASDLKTINHTLGNNAIKTAFFEILQAKYNQSKTGFELDRQNIQNWMPDLTNTFANVGVGVTLNFTFSHALKANFFNLTQTQMNQLANVMVNVLLTNKNVDGISLDLEGGFDQPGAAQFYKTLADKLAYHGKWYAFYYFSDMFRPNVVASFGPLGVALISTYDVGAYRAPLDKTQAETVPGSISYTSQGFTNASTLYSAFNENASTSGSCNLTGKTILQPNGYCNLSINDSVSENSRRWTSLYKGTSAHNAMIHFNGKYQLVYPLAASATEWPNVEIWNPDFTKIYGNINTNTKLCQQYNINNDFFKTNAAALQDPSSKASILLQQCLFSNVIIPGTSLAVQTYQACPGYPYSQCIRVSSLPGASIDKTMVRSNMVNYVKSNRAVYDSNRVLPSTGEPITSTKAHEAGYAIFALETASSASSAAFNTNPGVFNPNATVQEPWYLGWQPAKRTDGKLLDPAYSGTNNTTTWQAFANLMANNK